MEQQQQSDLDRDRQYCELCGKMENLLKCGRCRSSFYCSKEHQKQDWKKHKLICKETDKAQLPKAKPEEPAPSGDDKVEEKYREKISPEDADSASLQPPTTTNTEVSGDVEDRPNNTPNGQSQPTSSPQKLATEYIVPCMNKHGICVVDNFLGADTGLGILDNVKALHKTGKFTDGQLVSQKSDSTKDIRGDQITWIEGREAGCEKICFLMSRMDDLIRHCNGKLGNYKINGRTKLVGDGGQRLSHSHVFSKAEDGDALILDPKSSSSFISNCRVNPKQCQCRLRVTCDSPHLFLLSPSSSSPGREVDCHCFNEWKLS